MSDEVHRERFRTDELRRVDESMEVFHASGGGPMTVEGIERCPDGTTRMLCGWTSDAGPQRHVFDARCLRMMRRLSEDDLARFTAAIQ